MYLINVSGIDDICYVSVFWHMSCGLNLYDQCSLLNQQELVTLLKYNGLFRGLYHNS